MQLKQEKAGSLQVDGGVSITVAVTYSTLHMLSAYQYRPMEAS